MANKLYPELPYYANLEMVTSQQLYNDLIRYASEMKFLLEQRDFEVEVQPATRVRTVVSVGTIGRPEEGFIVYAAKVKKYKGYVSGTGWVDFH
jgi:hypothetical protein